MLEYLGYGLGIATLVFFIMIVVKMFQNGSTVLGIVTILTCLCGIGYLVALIFGWMKAGEWKIKPLMALYTICLLGNLVLTGANFTENYEKFQKQWKEAMEQQKR